MLRLGAVSMKFGGLQVLHDVDVSVPKGSIYGLIGPNGAGKTTVFNIVTGLIKPTSGEVEFCGTQIAGMPPHVVAEHGIARTFQNIRIFKQLRLVDNVIVGMHRHLRYAIPSSLFSLPKYRAAEKDAMSSAHDLLSWVGLDHKAEEPAGTLSYGEQRRLELARALATRPRLLLLDEPVAGMNAREKSELMLTIAQIRDRGFTILMIEHDMRFVMGLCDYISVLSFGQVISCGRPEDVRSDSLVIEAYLGPEEASRGDSLSRSLN